MKTEIELDFQLNICTERNCILKYILFGLIWNCHYSTKVFD